MSTRSDQAQLERDLEEEGTRESTAAARRGVLNWFGAAFGLTVLIGASIFYLSARLSPDSDVLETPTAPVPTMAPPADDAPGQQTLESDQVEASPDPALGRIEVLLGSYVAGSLETHMLDEIYADVGTVDDAHAAEIAQLLAALDAVEWPEELSDVAATFRAEVAELLQAMEAGDMEGVGHGLEAVHAAQHSLSSGVYAWLSGAPMPVNMDDASSQGVVPDETVLQLIEIEMFEFGYTPATIDIEAGIPVVFRFTNSGRLPHEAMVGDTHMQEEFAAAGDHDETDAGSDHHGDLMATLVQPGETQELQVLIEEPGTWYVACHLVGHYEQGQIATINVRG